MTRDAARARQREPAIEWIGGNVEDPAACAGALDGRQAALYLVHGIDASADYHRREVTTAATFSRAAATGGIERVVYLGGVAPTVGPGSVHLRSHHKVGETLRSGAVKTIELRASMIVGYGSLSWLIVLDMAARLPVMVLPRWLKSPTQPVAISDVVIALVRALDLPFETAPGSTYPVPSRFPKRKSSRRPRASWGSSARA